MEKESIVVNSTFHSSVALFPEFERRRGGSQTPRLQIRVAFLLGWACSSHSSTASISNSHASNTRITSHDELLVRTPNSSI
eukprot:scaffold8_cov142-Skeletonema_marinoi.AAC.29